MTEPALIAVAAGDRRVHDHQISRLHTGCPISDIFHYRAALMANAKWEMHDLVSDPSLSVIMEIGSADARPDDPEQYVRRILHCRSGPLHDFDFPDTCKHHSFHKVRLLSRESGWSLFPVSFEKKYIANLPERNPSLSSDSRIINCML
jgi:hypothetical protein